MFCFGSGKHILLRFWYPSSPFCTAISAVLSVTAIVFPNWVSLFSVRLGKVCLKVALSFTILYTCTKPASLLAKGRCYQIFCLLAAMHQPKWACGNGVLLGKVPIILPLLRSAIYTSPAVLPLAVVLAPINK